MDLSVATPSTSKISLSIQGQLFILPKSLLTEFDWMPAQIVTSQIPWELVNENQYYLDVDPNSFRLILAILRGQSNVDSVADSIMPIDLEILRVSADYLGCKDLASKLVKTQHDHEIIKTLTEDINKLQAQVLEGESWFDLDKMKKEPIWKLSCYSYRTHRPYNRCGKIVLVIGADSVSEDTTDLTCKDCKASNWMVSRISTRLDLQNTLEMLRSPDNTISWA